MSLPFTMKRASEEVPEEDAVRARRMEIARKNTLWSELEEAALVSRGRWLVHADSDEVFSRFKAAVWSRGSAQISANDRVPLWFYIDQQGEVHFLERLPGTWSERVAKRARRRAPA